MELNDELDEAEAPRPDLRAVLEALLLVVDVPATESQLAHAANVEAFTTVAPEALPIEGQPEAVIFDSPNTPTIATLVDHANAHLDAPAPGIAGPATAKVVAR